MLTLIAFIVALALLIAVHEYGHYRVAVACGVKVLRFSIGFGKPIWRRQSASGTESSLATRRTDSANWASRSTGRGVLGYTELGVQSTTAAPTFRQRSTIDFKFASNCSRGARAVSSPTSSSFSGSARPS